MDNDRHLVTLKFFVCGQSAASGLLAILRLSLVDDTINTQITQKRPCVVARINMKYAVLSTQLSLPGSPLVHDLPGMPCHLLH